MWVKVLHLFLMQGEQQWVTYDGEKVLPGEHDWQNSQINQAILKKQGLFICIQQDVLYCIQIMLPTWGIFIVVFMTLLDLNKAIQLVSPASNL